VGTPKLLTIFIHDPNGRMKKKSLATIDGTFIGPDGTVELVASTLLLHLDQNNLREGNSSLSRHSIAKAGFIIAAGASFLFSIYLWFGGHREQGAFVGLWVPSTLSFGTLMLSGG
jgi:hypothetical protein